MSIQRGHFFMSNDYTFSSAYMQNRNVGRVIAQIDFLTERGSTKSKLLKWDRSQGRWFSFNLDWQAIQLSAPEDPEVMVLAVGADGLVSVSTLAGPTEEAVDTSADGPARRGPIRDLQIIGGTAYVAGMGRQVYRREQAGNWTRQDDGMVLARGQIQLCGFNSIGGMNETLIYAVGFNGEIWKCSNGQWLQQDSPPPWYCTRSKSYVRTSFLLADNREFCCETLAVVGRPSRRT
ncbi:hypothetical protein [Xanthomonas floridensis]|uniref:Uncharacterized protein n=2 Tax=Xanthomonas floridensis TaxID=1843580 RepID=A0ABU5PUH0_9XANT|nr:hypothetical protein [Xanthomonas floridensis]MEA5123251.1 hypothetical protein [Xanthomonas floridensis]MEA5130723.1 hypothetical protein [Xanthomonas floridensis]